MFLSHAGLNRFTPYATPILILSANAPDADIVTLIGGPLNYFHFHRHISHSLIFAPLLAALVVAIVRISVKKPFPLRAAFFIALAGLVSHLLLDLTNAYGVRIFLPFSAEWLHWDITNVIDFWILSFFALCLAAPFLSKLVGSEIGGVSRQSYPGRGFATLALTLLALYDGGRAVAHSRALATIDAREYDRGRALRVAAFPPSSNPFRWKGIAESQDRYRVFDLDLTQPFDPATAQTLYKANASSAIDAASRSEPFQVFGAFAQFPLWQTAPVALGTTAGNRVVLTDLRFSFFTEALISPTNAVVTARFSY